MSDLPDGGDDRTISGRYFGVAKPSSGITKTITEKDSAFIQIRDHANKN
jgi:hypothetical protein